MSATGPKKGSLVMVGTGIRSLGQLTLEAIEYIEKADVVYYGVRDAVTEGFIKARNKNTVDLDVYYLNAEEIPSLDTFIHMAELMVADVRKGLRVVGAFCGHPGKFMTPTRRAMAIAQQEGYFTKMLPGISTECCLLADLGIDPSFAGSMPLMPQAFSYRLLRSPDSKTRTSLTQPLIEKFTISDLHKPQFRKRINASSTLYFPPKEVLPLAEFGRELLACGKVTEELLENAQYPRNMIHQPVGANQDPGAYTEYAKKALASLDSLTISSKYRGYSASMVMQKAVERVLLDLNMREAYLRSPEVFAESVDGLKDVEKAALASGDFQQINTVMKCG